MSKSKYKENLRLLQQINVLLYKKSKKFHIPKHSFILY